MPKKGETKSKTEVVSCQLPLIQLVNERTLIFVLLTLSFGLDECYNCTFFTEGNRGEEGGKEGRAEEGVEKEVNAGADICLPHKYLR